MPTPFELQARDEALARAFASGATDTQVGAAYDLTPEAVRSLKRDLADRITHYRERMQLASQIQLRYAESMCPKAMGNLERVLDDPGHRDNVRVSLEVFKLGLPTRASIDAGGDGLQLTMSDTTANRLADILGKAMVQRAGIELPLMYRLGYDNANCIGCVKGGEGYWRAIREDFPDEFEELAAVQDEIGEGAYLFRNRKTGERYSLRQIPLGPARRNEAMPSCSFFCELAEMEYAA